MCTYLFVINFSRIKSNIDVKWMSLYPLKQQNWLYVYCIASKHYSSVYVVYVICRYIRLLVVLMMSLVLSILASTLALMDGEWRIIINAFMDYWLSDFSSFSGF